MLNSEYQNQLLTIIKKHVPTCTVYLYGSRARGDHQPSSDIDLAIDAGAKIHWHILSDIRNDIEESTIPFFVDVVDVHDSDQDFSNEIKKDWIRLI